MNKLDVAVIDSKVDVNIVDYLYKQYADNGICGLKSIHGTICCTILNMFSKNLRISNYEVLIDDDRGNLNDLDISLKWCEENKIKLVNISLGSICFLDFKRIKKVINHYSNRGMILVVATSNENYVSYPSLLTSVIGVSHKHRESLEQNLHRQFLGIDIFEESQHFIEIYGTKMKTEICNSYATPLVTAKVGELIYNNKELTLKQIKQMLSNQLFENPNTVDWIDTAYIYGDLSKSNVIPYFNITNDINCADTIILCEKIHDLEFFGNRHIVDLFGENDILNTNEYFYWSKKNKVTQISQECSKETYIDIPIIEINFADSLDMLYITTKLNEIFMGNEYNSYITTSFIECVLYEIEYIPKEYLINNDKKIIDFLYYEILYNKIDILIINNYYKKNNTHILIDVMINISKLKQDYCISFTDCETNENKNIIVNVIDEEIISLIYNEIINMF